jgi:hypothetical protein
MPTNEQLEDMVTQLGISPEAYAEWAASKAGTKDGRKAFEVQTGGTRARCNVRPGHLAMLVAYRHYTVSLRRHRSAAAVVPIRVVRRQNDRPQGIQRFMMLAGALEAG